MKVTEDGVLVFSASEVLELRGKRTVSDVLKLLQPEYLHGCYPAVDWLNSFPAQTPAQTAWYACETPEWLMWLLGRLHMYGGLSRADLRRARYAAEKAALRFIEDSSSAKELLAKIEAAYQSPVEKSAAEKEADWALASCYAARALHAKYVVPYSASRKPIADAIREEAYWGFVHESLVNCASMRPRKVQNW